MITALKYIAAAVVGGLLTFFVGIPLYFIIDYLRNGSRQ